jgi:hypothetical protein
MDSVQAVLMVMVLAVQAERFMFQQDNSQALHILLDLVICKEQQAQETAARP